MEVGAEAAAVEPVFFLLLAAVCICFRYLALGEGGAEVEGVLGEADGHEGSTCPSISCLYDGQDPETGAKVSSKIQTYG